MKNLSFILILMMASLCYGQQNLMGPLQQHNNVDFTTITEANNNFYFLTYDLVTIQNRQQARFTLRKHNKLTYQFIDSVYAYGDIVQSDSSTIPISWTRLSIVGNTITMCYYKNIITGTGSEQYIYLRQFDTALNEVLPETRIGEGYYQNYVAMPNGEHLIAYNKTDAHYVAMFYKVSAAGTVIANNSLGITIPQNLPPRVIEIKNTTSNKYLVTGTSVLPIKPYVSSFNWYLADSAMNILDTFYFKTNDNLPFSSATPNEFLQRPPNILMLPDGSMISAACIGNGTFQTGNPTPEPFYGPFLGKYKPADRFKLDKYWFGTKIDSLDLFHANNPAMESFIYNKADQNIYYASVSHRGNLLGDCYNVTNPPGNSLYNYGYIEIVSLNTDLQLRWKKYIKFNIPQTQCFYPMQIISPDGRPGVLVSGYYDSTAVYGQLDLFNQQQFLYYITDTTTTVDVPPYGTGITEHQAQSGINIYPNPATDNIMVSDKAGSLLSVHILDMSGRLISKTDADKATLLRVSIEDIAKGIYLLKAYTKDNQVAPFKFIKR